MTRLIQQLARFLLASAAFLPMVSLADFGFPASVPFPAQIGLRESNELAVEDVAEAEIPASKDGKIAVVRGKRVVRTLNYAPAPGEPALGFYNGSEERIFKSVSGALGKAGWQLVWVNANKDVFSLKRGAAGAEAWIKVSVDAPQAYVTVELVEPAGQQAAFALPKPQPVPEKYADKDDIPYLLPPKGSMRKEGQARASDPLDVGIPGSGQEARLAGTSTVLRGYQAPAALSKLQFIEDYHKALLAAGWTVIYPEAGRIKDAGEIIARYAQQGRDIWARMTYEYGASLSFAVTDAGAEDWSAKLKKDCKVPLYGVFFDFNKSTIKPESEPVLAKAAALIKSVAGPVEVRGHTDAVGGEESNLKLSDARAASVRAWLAGKGVDALRLTSKGFGKSQPVADNATEQGRAKNRRVELVQLQCKAK